jgi:hypothetical protein
MLPRRSPVAFRGVTKNENIKLTSTDDDKEEEEERGPRHGCTLFIHSRRVRELGCPSLPRGLAEARKGKNKGGVDTCQLSIEKLASVRTDEMVLLPCCSLHFFCGSGGSCWVPVDGNTRSARPKRIL